MDAVRLHAGRDVLRVVWLPGSDLLRGTCHCGATHVAEGPVEVWEWLLAHPTGHSAPSTPAPSGAGAVAGSDGVAASDAVAPADAVASADVRVAR
ncbi:hypothetical protein BKM31_30130 [[Actinomadura] parvosata subsp. kistnae]|uniref:Uncharacterized protein n=1 Tax=[Actinomadura] parvosata subsp. kistnae TaxID=1909395 RepID=A0A1V0A4I7_9ACTN|nr:hypothetical protein [Nonomuraea sp. ATCC 55076]AQZ65135.1 hypothetical protein BKM31_30130 [Nonomuraea sp. ATCC 55076]